MNAKVPRRSPLGLLVLLQLMGEPMHVYRMQKLIESQGKDRVVNVRSRASLYQTVERLARHGLVEVDRTLPGGTRPDRTVFVVTDAGRVAAREWLRQMLRSTSGEYPEFIAAVSMLFALDPDDARAQLELRADALETQLAEAEAELGAYPGLPRLFLLEEEYVRTVLRAELAWVRGVVDDLRAGRLAWDEAWVRAIGTTFDPDGEQR
jgi:DNA-binding PadR family transcriptional regulator